MGKHLFLCVAACFLIARHAYCQESGQAISNSQLPDMEMQPRFVNGILLVPQNNESGTKNVIDTRSAGNLSSESAEKPVMQVTREGQEEMTDNETGNDDNFNLNSEIGPVIAKYSEIVGVDHAEIASNFSLYTFIDDWYGTEYKWGGTDSAGIDCSGFSQKLYGSVYGLGIDRTARQQHRRAEHIRYIGDANEGDLVFFRVHYLRISHVGIYLANGFFVHASRTHGVVISNLNDRYWRRRYAGCGRMPHEEHPLSESDFSPRVD